MSKRRPGFSPLIEAFFSEIGYTPQWLRRDEFESECDPRFEQLAIALDAIVNEAEKPDAALNIERFGGRPTAAYKEPLAWRIRRWLERGDKWAVIEIQANEWLARNGFEVTLSEKRLINLYGESDASRGVFGSLDAREWARNRRK